MPKIVIKEYDKTTAGNTAYANFAVVVPGFVGTPKEPVEAGKKFDDNGIYECTSQSDFITYIGKREASEVSVEDKTKILSEAVEPTGNAISTFAEGEFDQLKAGGILYTFETNTTGTIGYLKSAKRTYTKVAADATYSATNKYAKILPGNEGADVVYGVIVTKSQMGNQIAYELLGLGYTVLFKKLTKEDLSELSDASWWEPLLDKATYDFRYIVNGLIYGVEQENDTISAVATARGDVIALVDIDAAEYIGKSQIAAIEAIRDATSASGDKNTAIFAPLVYYNFVDKDYCPDSTKPTQFPASFHYLACAANAAESYNEWYAIAGYTRGISKYTISGVAIKFGEAAIEALEPRTNVDGTDKAVNLVVQIKKAYYLWGNRTAKALDGNGLIASHFLNIRQLCTTIKKQVYVACRQCTFDPNGDLLWVNFCNKIRPTLEKMKGDQGINDYKFIKVKNTQKAILTAIIRIVPIEAVEDFDISIYLEDSISGTAVGIEETEEV